MAEGTVVELADRTRGGLTLHDLRGMCTIASDQAGGYSNCRPTRMLSQDKRAFIECSTPSTATTTRSRPGPVPAAGHALPGPEPAGPYLDQEELDSVHELDYERSQHPYYDRRRGQGAGDDPVLHHHPPRLLWGVQFLLHRRASGANGALAQRGVDSAGGRDAWLRTRISKATSRMWAVRRPICMALSVGRSWSAEAARTSVVSIPEVCPSIEVDHSGQIDLLQRLRQIEGVKKVFVAQASATTWCWRTGRMVSGICARWCGAIPRAR